MHRTRPAPGLLLGLLMLVALVVVAGHLGEGREFLELARRARPGWLLLALAAQVLTYATEAGVWGTVLRRAGQGRPLAELYGLSVVALFTNQAVPTAGLAGSVLVVRTLDARGVPRPAVLAAVLVDLVGYYAAYALAVGAAVAVLVVHHDLSWAVLATTGVFGLVALGIAAGAFWIASPGRQLPPPLARIRPLERAVDALSEADPALVRDPTLILRAFLLRAGNFALDATTLWTCLRAVGDPTGPGPALAAFVMGCLARTLGIVPGGLGTFEAATVAGLALFGTRVEPALTATLLFRGLSFWLPMLPGFWLGPRLAGRRPGAAA